MPFDDVAKCFEEVHRVLRESGLFVFSIGHPCAILDGTTLIPTRSYFDTGKVVEGRDVSGESGFAFAENRRTVSDYFNALVAAGFSVERIVEPDVRPVDHSDPENRLWGRTPELLEVFPSTLVFKSRKVLKIPGLSTKA